MAKVRRHVIVEGIVQGVFFRSHTQKQARALGVTGWVRNCWDGTVEIIAEGEEGQVDELIRWCHEGPPEASVTRVRVEEAPHRGEFERFDVRY